MTDNKDFDIIFWMNPTLSFGKNKEVKLQVLVPRTVRVTGNSVIFPTTGTFIAEDLSDSDIARLRTVAIVEATA